MTRRVEICILGPLRVTDDGREVRSPAKQQVLLALLALDRGTVSTERLAAALWGEDASPGVLRTLQSHVVQLRRALAAVLAWLLDSDPAIRWQVLRDLAVRGEAEVSAKPARARERRWAGQDGHGRPAAGPPCAMRVVAWWDGA